MDIFGGGVHFSTYSSYWLRNLPPLSGLNFPIYGVWGLGHMASGALFHLPPLPHILGGPGALASSLEASSGGGAHPPPQQGRFPWGGGWVQWSEVSSGDRKPRAACALTWCLSDLSAALHRHLPPSSGAPLRGCCPAQDHEKERDRAGGEGRERADRQDPFLPPHTHLCQLCLGALVKSLWAAWVPIGALRRAEPCCPSQPPQMHSSPSEMHDLTSGCLAFWKPSKDPRQVGTPGPQHAAAATPGSPGSPVLLDLKAGCGP